ncbi:hypothetical protein C7H73_11255 [Pulveribacter suum]|uniref:Uncharacterized protein n=3 Tax=Comamonadaceae TaxID=80864 RepID=A0A2P1NM95_9BURK|nr:hypothetical protein C7H73_11255 [Pulveribacter suum]
MFTLSPAPWLACLTTFVALTAGAQNSHGTTPVPSQTPALPYNSAMEGYKALSDEKPIPWRAANTTVEQRGGWRAYAKEAAGEDAAGTPSAGHGQGHAMPAPTAKEKP